MMSIRENKRYLKNFDKSEVESHFSYVKGEYLFHNFSELNMFHNEQDFFPL